MKPGGKELRERERERERADMQPKIQIAKKGPAEVSRNLVCSSDIFD